MIATDAPRRIQWTRRKGVFLPANARLITRPTEWGNPFKIISPVRGQNRTWRVIWSGRGGKWNDPRPEWHPEPKDADRYLTAEFAHLAAVDFYRLWISTEAPQTFAYRMWDQLRGKDLACSCYPEMPCHGDAILRAIEIVGA